MNVTKVISLHQPWATLFVAGVKLIETRSWQTSHRGPLAVHAAKTIDISACYRHPFTDELVRLGFDNPEELPTGVVLGAVNLESCVEMVQTTAASADVISLANDPRLTVLERAFGNYNRGRFAWVTSLRPRILLAEPIPLRGFQRIWNLPKGITERLAL